MHWMGFTLNVVTLLSLSLVVGILVDDAIVEIENIMRHLGKGVPCRWTPREAADEIGLAVIATTFTLISVFLPTAFAAGVPGKFFVQFGWTAALAVFFSLVVARMLTPMMAAYILKRPRRPQRPEVDARLPEGHALVPAAPGQDPGADGRVRRGQLRTAVCQQDQWRFHPARRPEPDQVTSSWSPAALTPKPGASPRTRAPCWPSTRTSS